MKQEHMIAAVILVVIYVESRKREAEKNVKKTVVNKVLDTLKK